jgi:NAD(P)-dependent dehydrogenase (short-subunit alcohol dehydrogenase family)
MPEQALRGKSAWVTGGASGMGRATALALARLGASVAIGSLVASQRDVVLENQNCHTPPDAKLTEVEAEIAALGVNAMALRLDVCSNDSVTASYNEIIKRFGKIDILINAAGSSTRMLMVNHSDDLWHRMMDVNLTGTYRTIKLCLPGMIERRWGRIINFASTAANLGYPTRSAYCASKSGILGLTRCVALEGAPYGVSCNAINPGYVDTDSSYSAAKQAIAMEGLNISVEEYRENIACNLPQKRFLEPAEVAELAVFLCRDEAFGITGQDVTIAMGSLW